MEDGEEAAVQGGDSPQTGLGLQVNGTWGSTLFPEDPKAASAGGPISSHFARAVVSSHESAPPLPWEKESEGQPASYSSALPASLHRAGTQ